jgi:hypothetical protein
MFENLLQTTTKIYEFDYEQGNVAGENYLRFLQYKLSLTKQYSEDWMTIQRQMKKVEDDLNKSSTEGTKEAAKEKSQVFRLMLKDLQRSATDIIANLFTDLLSGHKNPFQAFIDAFKSMLIRMAAELAASELMKGLINLFHPNKGPGGGGGQKKRGLLGSIGSVFGGSVGGAIGGVLGGILGFDDGGWVPGRAGAPQLAVVHAGEFVLSRAHLAAMNQGGSYSTRNSGGNVAVHFHGDMHVRNDQDIRRIASEMAWHIQTLQPARPGSGAA